VAEVGENPSVVNVGTANDALLNFTLPAPIHGRDGKVGATGQTGPVGPEGPRGRDGLAVTAADVAEAARELRDAKKKMFAAVLKARLNAGTLKGNHERRMANFIVDMLEKDLQS